MENKYLDKIRDFLDSGTKKASVAKVVLCVLAVASLPVVMFGAVSIGNAVQLFGKHSKYNKRYSKKQIQNAVSEINRQKIIKYVYKKDGTKILKITKKGESKLKKFIIDSIEIKKPDKWNGKWHIVIFDVPVRFTKGRESLRLKLKDLGFIQLQKSVWIYPYPCEKEILFIVDFFRISQYVEILITDSFLNENKLKKYFNLN